MWKRKIELSSINIYHFFFKYKERKVENNKIRCYLAYILRAIFARMRRNWRYPTIRQIIKCDQTSTSIISTHECSNNSEQKIFFYINLWICQRHTFKSCDTKRGPHWAIYNVREIAPEEQREKVQGIGKN